MRNKGSAGTKTKISRPKTKLKKEDIEDKVLKEYGENLIEEKSEGCIGKALEFLKRRRKYEW